MTFLVDPRGAGVLGGRLSKGLSSSVELKMKEKLEYGRDLALAKLTQLAVEDQVILFINLSNC